MSKLKHVGRRPEYPVVYDEKLRGTYTEMLPDGSYRVWNKKTINSGCGNVITVFKKDIKDGLIYCRFCGEMANENQFIKEEVQ